jgi:pimeloyl-ACP methyl ester carboxylesterase
MPLDEKDPNRRFEDFYSRIRYKDLSESGAGWRYLDMGPADGRTVVFLTGGLKHPLWSFPILGLLVDEYRVIAPVLPPVSDIDGLLDGIKRILDNESVSNCTMTGSSWGGNLVQCLTYKYPNIADKIILSNTGAMSSRLILPALKLHLKSTKKKPAEKVLAEYKKRVLALLSRPPEYSAFWASLIERFYTELFTYEDYITLIENQIGYLERYAFKISEKTCKKPVLYILTKDETASSKKVRENVKKLYPNIVCKEFETGGHAVALAHPDEFRETVGAFLS